MYDAIRCAKDVFKMSCNLLKWNNDLQSMEFEIVWKTGLHKNQPFKTVCDFWSSVVPLGFLFVIWHLKNLQGFFLKYFTIFRIDPKNFPIGKQIGIVIFVYFIAYFFLFNSFFCILIRWRRFEKMLHIPLLFQIIYRY